jgi:hypothetical protein
MTLETLRKKRLLVILGFDKNNFHLNGTAKCFCPRSHIGV